MSVLSAGLLAILSVGCIACLGQSTANPGSSGKLKLLSETLIEEPDFDLEYKASVASRKFDTFWLVLGRRPTGTMSGPQKLALRTLNQAGKTLANMPLDALVKAAGIADEPDRLIDLAATEDGNLSVILGSNGRIWVVTVDGNTHLVTRGKDIAPSSKDVSIGRALPGPGGSLMLIGNSGRGPITIKLDPNLAIVWEKLADPDSVSRFMDGFISEDGTFVLSGNFVKGTQVSQWVGRFSAHGKVEASIAIPGQSAILAGAPDGGCTIVQEIATYNGPDYWFRTYDQNLKELWSYKLYSGNWNLLTVPLARVPQAPMDYLVTGFEKRRLQISKVRALSGILWSRTPELQTTSEPLSTWNAGLAPAASSVFVSSTEFVMYKSPEGYRQRQILHIMNVDTK